MNKSTPLVIILVLIAVFLIFMASRTQKYEAEPTPTPTPSATEDGPSKQQKYIDMMTSKCYDENEIEVSCKG